MPNNDFLPKDLLNDALCDQLGLPRGTKCRRFIIGNLDPALPSWLFDYSFMVNAARPWRIIVAHEDRLLLDESMSQPGHRIRRRRGQFEVEEDLKYLQVTALMSVGANRYRYYRPSATRKYRGRYYRNVMQYGVDDGNRASRRDRTDCGLLLYWYDEPVNARTGGRRRDFEFPYPEPGRPIP